MNIETKSYPDNTIYVDLGFPWANRDAFPMDPYNHNVFRINNYEDLFRLEALSDALRSARPGPEETFDILIPNLLHSQDDRRWKKGQSYGLSIILKRLIALENFKYHFFHVHNESVVEMAFNIVGQQHRLNFIDNSEFLNTVIESLIPSNNLAILSPDAGAYKWIAKVVHDTCGFDIPIYAASKIRRKGKAGDQQLPIQDFEGKDLLLIDDLLIGGSTMINLANMLKEHNVGKVYGAVSHTTIKSPREEICEVFDKFFTSNSKYEQADYTLNPKIFKVLTLFDVT